MCCSQKRMFFYEHFLTVLESTPNKCNTCTYICIYINMLLCVRMCDRWKRVYIDISVFYLLLHLRAHISCSPTSLITCLKHGTRLVFFLSLLHTHTLHTHWLLKNINHLKYDDKAEIEDQIQFHWNKEFTPPGQSKHQAKWLNLNVEYIFRYIVTNHILSCTFESNPSFVSLFSSFKVWNGSEYQLKLIMTLVQSRRRVVRVWKIHHFVFH